MADADGTNFGHPPGLQFGENLYWHSNVSTNCDHMVRGWYDEIGLYSFDSPRFSAEVGHFTQVVWRDTKFVGCATRVSKGPRGGIFLTCNYDPPGNFIGEFNENVARKLIIPNNCASNAPNCKPPSPIQKPVGVQKPTTIAPAITSRKKLQTTQRPVENSLATLPNNLPTTPSPAGPGGPTTSKPKGKKKKKNKDKNKKKGRKNKRKKQTSTTSTTTTIPPRT